MATLLKATCTPQAAGADRAGGGRGDLGHPALQHQVPVAPASPKSHGAPGFPASGPLPTLCGRHPQPRTGHHAPLAPSALGCAALPQRPFPASPPLRLQQSPAARAHGPLLAPRESAEPGPSPPPGQGPKRGWGRHNGSSPGSRGPGLTTRPPLAAGPTAPPGATRAAGGEAARPEGPSQWDALEAGGATQPAAGRPPAPAPAGPWRCGHSTARPTSFFRSTCWSPFSAAIFFTKSFVSPPRGKRVLLKASWETWLRKKVWSLRLSAAWRSCTAAEREEQETLVGGGVGPCAPVALWFRCCSRLSGAGLGEETRSCSGPPCPARADLPGLPLSGPGRPTARAVTSTVAALLPPCTSQTCAEEPGHAVPRARHTRVPDPTAGSHASWVGRITPGPQMRGRAQMRKRLAREGRQRAENRGCPPNFHSPAARAQSAEPGAGGRQSPAGRPSGHRPKALGPKAEADWAVCVQERERAREHSHTRLRAREQRAPSLSPSLGNQAPSRLRGAQSGSPARGEEVALGEAPHAGGSVPAPLPLVQSSPWGPSPRP